MLLAVAALALARFRSLCIRFCFANRLVKVGAGFLLIVGELIHALCAAG